MAVRVYEFSKESGISNKDLIKILEDGGYAVTSHMSVLTDDALVFLKNHLSGSNKKTKLEKPKKINQDDIKKPVKEPAALMQNKLKNKPEKKSTKFTKKDRFAPQAKFEKRKKPEEKIEPLGVELKPMMVGDFAEKAQKPASEIILTLLREGVMATKNQIIPEDVVAKLAEVFEIPIIQPDAALKKEGDKTGLELSETRMPVVVIIGHVDHGKTTLMDHIRKTRVAEKEIGGITQHLGAYQVQIPQGGVVFLDTPGHEAFSIMRARGVRVADVAVLVVAADDSVMPQTIEAIKHARSVNVPIIVAINKIDKASEAQIEKVKRDLVQHELMPEEWGGQTVMVPISAKDGTGIEDLLEMIVLQSDMLELQTNSKISARGYVLESKIQKGLGPVATVICHYGTLCVGDYFQAGSVFGKISTLIDSAGKRIRQAGPSTPVLIAGFSSLPEAGDIFEVVSAADVRKAKRAQTTAQASVAGQTMVSEGEQAIKILLRADNASSAEALGVGIKKLAKKLPADQKLVVVHSGIGDISESDILLAADTGAIIYGFSVKVGPAATTLAAHEKVDVRLFGIIYKLFEDIEAHAEKIKIVKTVSKKIGEAEVLKIFKVKGVGVIAGARVKSGMFTRNGSVIAYRGNEKLGGGSIRSLQRDKQAAKEVQTGFECAFLIDKFDNWEPGDRVECYIEVPEE